MSRDRLAAMRSQQPGGYSDSSYPPADSYGEGGRGYNGYEMSNVNDGPGDGGDDMPAFYEEIDSIKSAIKQLRTNITTIGDLHSRSLNNMDEVAAERNAKQMAELIDDTSDITSDLKRRIKALERLGSSGRDGAIRKVQTGLVKSQFIEAIQDYQEVEKNYRQKYKGRMERQFRIVKPDATEEEVKAIVNDTGGGQIFAQALTSTNRYGDSRAAYREVQERHEDIKRIEKTLTELAQLFQDMAVLVEEQDDTLNVIEAHAQQIDYDMEQGVKEVDGAVTHAASARKKRWICFAIIVAILIIVAIIIAVIVTRNTGGGGGGGSGSGSSSSGTPTGGSQP